MKFRAGFVSNSSSSSFIIQKKRYSEDELELILHPQKYIDDIKKEKINRFMWEDDLTRDEAEYQVNNQSAFECVEDASMWEIIMCNDEIKFYTDMDNFLWDEYIKVVSTLTKEGIEHILNKV